MRRGDQGSDTRAQVGVVQGYIGQKVYLVAENVFAIGESGGDRHAVLCTVVEDILAPGHRRAVGII